MRKSTVLGWWILVSLIATFSFGCDDTKLNTIERVPVSVQISVSPWLDRYALNDQVKLDYVVLDADGIVIPDVPATWTKPSADQVEDLGSGYYQLSTMGEHSWTVTLDPPYSSISSSVTLQVSGAPDSLVITVDPEQDYYRVGQQVTLGYEVRDADGVLLENISASWQDPGGAGVVSLGNRRFQFAAAGVYTWRVTLEPPFSLSAERSLEVDDSGPSLMLTTPERGDTLLKDTQDDSIPVQGTVSDDMGEVASLTMSINGEATQAVAVQANGAFTQLMPVLPGVNLLEVHATDTAGNVTTLTRAFHYATDFFSYENDIHNRERVPERLHGLITDRAFDRGTPPGYDPCDFDGSGNYLCDPLADVASLLEIGLNLIEFEDRPPVYHEVWPFFPPRTEGFTFSGINGDVEVTATITGEFILDLSFSDIGVGLGKVEQLASMDYALDGDMRFVTFTGDDGQVYSGLNADLGLTGQAVFLVTINLVAQDPTDQAIACFAADYICDGGNCLSDYLPACVGTAALPALSSITTISSPVLIGLDIDEVDVNAEWSVYLDTDQEPRVTLASMDLNFGAGGLDLSLLSQIDLQLGVVELFGWEIIDLGQYEFDTSFLQDLADGLFNPVMDALLPIIEPFMGQFFSCSDTENPLCFFVPFTEELFASWTTDGVLDVPDLYDPITEPAAVAINLRTDYDELKLTAGQGAQLTIGGRIDSTTAPALASHSDDDLLGLALVNGCRQSPDNGLGSWPSSAGQAMQSMPAFDLFNMISYAAWNAGLYDFADLGDAQLDLSGQAVSGLQLDVQPWLAPLLVADCPADAAPQVWAGWGDMHMAGQFTRNGAVYSFDGFVGLLLPGAVEGDGASGLSFLAQSGARATCELELSVDGAMADEAQETFTCDLLSQVVLGDMLRRAVNQSLSTAEFFVPTYDLSDYTGVPAGTALGLSDWDVSQLQGRVMIGGDY